jgi:hypothetical protein
LPVEAVSVAETTAAFVSLRTKASLSLPAVGDAEMAAEGTVAVNDEGCAPAVEPGAVGPELELVLPPVSVPPLPTELPLPPPPELGVPVEPPDEPPVLPAAADSVTVRLKVACGVELPRESCARHEMMCEPTVKRPPDGRLQTRL